MTNTKPPASTHGATPLALQLNMHPTWSAAPHELSLPPRTLHLWRLQDAEELLQLEPKLVPLLSADEYQQAQRFHFDKGRRQALLSRYALRVLLGLYLHTDGKQLQIPTDEFGKPFLAPSQNNLHIEFNLTHTEGCILLAFTCDVALGVDAESLCHQREFADIAKRYFSPAEYRELMALPAAQRSSGFYAGWTRKEAFVKAIGRGLPYGLDKFTVTLSPDVAPRLVDVAADATEAENWSILSFCPGENLLGAVATRQPISQVEFFDFMPLLPEL